MRDPDCTVCTLLPYGSCDYHEKQDVLCPECHEPTWDEAFASKLHKCWNSEGHAGGSPLVFDTPWEAGG